MDAAKDEIRRLAAQCAETAWAAQSTEWAGLGVDTGEIAPLDGDWQALEREFGGQYAADDDAETFEAAYKARALALIGEANDRVDTAWTADFMA